MISVLEAVRPSNRSPQFHFFRKKASANLHGLRGGRCHFWERFPHILYLMPVLLFQQIFYLVRNSARHFGI